jgi:hypothetical protein
MHRPIIVTDNRKTYSNAFEMTQGHQHLYHCVQPLEAGQVMFKFNPDEADRNRNNFSLLTDRTYSTTDNPLKDQKEDEVIPFYSWFFASFLMVVVISVYALILILSPHQTAFNDVYLTQFDHTGNSYELAYAGKINPLLCIVCAIFCACTSILIGWQSQYTFGKILAFFLFVLILVFQLAGIFLHSMKLFDGTSQNNTVMLTLHSIWGLHLASTVISFFFVMIFTFGVDHDAKSPERQTWLTFWPTVVEDLNTIVCYVFVVCACNAQSGLHDDSSLFFDVVCVVMIGFLQHVANILMIFHGHVQVENSDQVSNPGSDLHKIINIIARTRLLIFFMIGILVVFFYLRITPTYEEFSLAIPYEILRVLAIITMVSLNTLHSMWYELSNAYGNQKPWESSPKWKIVTTLFIALIFSALVWRNVALSNHEIDKKYLTDFTIAS